MDAYPAPYVAMLFPVLIWLGVVIFMLVLALRLVRGVERIAEALERKS